MGQAIKDLRTHFAMNKWSRKSWTSNFVPQNSSYINVSVTYECHLQSGNSCIHPIFLQQLTSVWLTGSTYMIMHQKLSYLSSTWSFYILVFLFSFFLKIGSPKIIVQKNSISNAWSLYLLCRNFAFYDFWYLNTINCCVELFNIQLIKITCKNSLAKSFTTSTSKFIGCFEDAF